MVMHSNERGECCPHTLIDRKRKRYDNAVDVVIRLHDLTDPRTEGTAPSRSPDPAEVEGEFPQHDGVVAVIMKLPAQGFA